MNKVFKQKKDRMSFLLRKAVVNEIPLQFYLELRMSMEQISRDMRMSRRYGREYGEPEVQGKLVRTKIYYAGKRRNKYTNFSRVECAKDE